MANKVISIGNKKGQSNKNNQIYSDISMQALINTKHTLTTKYKSIQDVNLVIQTDEKTTGILVNDEDNSFLIHYLGNIEEIHNNFYRVSKNINVRAVQNALDNIFSWIPGERILNPEFGNNLYKYLYEGITEYNQEMIVAEINNCVTKWEPRVVIKNIKNVSNISDTEDNTVILNIEYIIKGLEGTIYNINYEFNRNQ